MMQNLSERDRTTLTFGGAIAGAVLVAVLVGFPVMNYWESLSKREADANNKIQEIQKRVDDATAASASLKELRADATLYADHGGLSHQTARMLQQVQQLPGYGQITVRRMEGIQPRSDENFYQSGVSMQFGGTLAGLHQFLKDVEKARPLLKVQKLTVTADKEDRSRIEGLMVINAYAVVTRRDPKNPSTRKG